LLLAVSAEATTFTVTSSADSGGSCPGSTCTLRQAIATAAASGDTVGFQIPTTDPGYNAATGAYTINLVSELLIAKSLTIDGSGSKIVLGGARAVRVFHVTAGTVVLAKLQITAADLSGVFTQGGAGILNEATLTVRECTIYGNHGGTGDGGGIRNTGILLLTNSTVSGNRVFRSVGEVDGGGIFNAGGATLTIANSTITGNNAQFTLAGAGIYNQSGGTVRLRNTVVAGNLGPNSANPSDTVGAFISDGFNFIGDASQSTGFMAGSQDQFGTKASPMDPKLGLLLDNGGPNPTHLPQVGSLLIDRGNRGTDANGQPINFDQRGQPRPVDRPEVNGTATDGSDIGAVERGPAQAGPNFVVTNIFEQFGEGCMTDDCSLPSAMNAANANADASTITFAPYVQGTIPNTLVRAGLSIASPMTISGPGARLLTINGNNLSRIFNIASAAGTVRISGLTLTTGRAGGSAFPENSGGALFNAGSLTLSDCTIRNNVAVLHGGAIFNNGQNGNAVLTLLRCTLTGNSAGASGAAIFSGASNGKTTIELTNCTLDQNNASQYGGAVYNDGNLGNAALTLTNCTLNKNNASSIAGGIYNDALNPNSTGIATTTLTNTILMAGTGANLVNDGGTISSQGNNLSSDTGGGFLNKSTDRFNTNPGLDILKNNGGPTDTVALLSSSVARDTGNDALAPRTDERGYFRNGTSDVGAFEFSGIAPGLVANVSTRLQVGQDDNALFEGFIIQGPAGSSKKIIVRALGPFLASCCGVTDALANPTLDIFQGNTPIATNNDWGTTQLGGIITADQSTEIAASGFAPSDGFESVIIANLGPGAYTAVARGLGNTTGIGLVDAFDLSAASLAKVVNFSTRGLVQPGQKLLTAGFIIQNGSVRAVIRAIGPSLISLIPNALPDTTLQLRNQNGDLVQENDDWESDQKAELQATGLQPTNSKEAALVRMIPAGQYTAQVRGKPEQTGVGVVEIYFID
jgi:hypothetical protein